jgi:excinuclease ABC subunit B
VTQRRRERQIAYNAANGIDPKTITKAVTDILARLRGSGEGTSGAKRSRADVRSGRGTRALRERAGLATAPGSEPPAEIAALIEQIEAEMEAAANELRYEEAALLRDELVELRAGTPTPALLATGLVAAEDVAPGT